MKNTNYFNIDMSNISVCLNDSDIEKSEDYNGNLFINFIFTRKINENKEKI